VEGYRRDELGSGADRGPQDGLGFFSVLRMTERLEATAAWPHEASRFPTGRMIMDAVEFHREPPANLPTMVVAFGGWIDAGEAVTGAMRYLIRQLAATPLAAIDPEDFFDFTQVRPVVRLSAAGECTIRWPRSAFWTWQPPEGRAGLLLFRGMEPQRRWRTYATALLDVAERCGVTRIVSLGALVAAVPHTRPPRVTGNSTDPQWQARLEAWGIYRRSRYQGPTGIASVVLDAATRRGLSYLTLMGQAPHYLEGATNPAVSRALLTYVTRLLSLELDMSPLEKAVQAFGTRCDQAVALDAATQAYVRQLEQDYDTTEDEAPRPQRSDDFNPEQLMQELEEFLREERKGGAE
jgi:proteasome assembly chaperone (PAC2) family protein